MTESHYCNICLTHTNGEVEQARVRSNVRRFMTEQFGVWRCPNCKSIHAADEVDLGYYYRGYPFHGSSEPDWAERAVYANMERRLKRVGLQKQHAILDYGCGSGALIRYLRSVGYEHAYGYDEFSDKFCQPELLERKYDCIVSQDVIEHVLDPWELMRRFQDLVNPGGVIAIGTPNAEVVNLANTEWHVHALHQPFHRHILSVDALRGLGEKLGLSIAHYYPTEYLNTFVPFINLRFVHHYLRTFDNTMDVAFERGRRDSWKLLTPVSLWFGLFGYFHSEDSGVMVVFRKAGTLAASSAAA